MADLGKYELERLTEDRWIAYLLAFKISNVFIFKDLIPVRRWRDASIAEVYPVIVVHCSSVPPSPEDPGIGKLFEAICELGVKTHRDSDKDRAIASGWLGKLRPAIYASGVCSSLTSSQIRFNGLVGSGGVHEGDADGINTMSVTVTNKIEVL